MSDHSKKDFRSDIHRARGLGSAHHGVHHWWMQRVSAIALIPLTGYFIYHLGQLVNPDIQAVIDFIARPYVTLAFILFILSAFYHGYLGVQVVIEDYVHSHAAKLTALLLNKFYFIVLGAGAIYALLRISFTYADFATRLD